MGSIAAEAEAEEDRGDEEGGPGTPDETEGVATEGGVTAVGLEGVTSLNKYGAASRYVSSCVSSCCWLCKQGERTYVMRDAAALRKSRAVADSRPEMAAPRRPQQARKAPKKAKTSKKSAIRKKTQPNLHM